MKKISWVQHYHIFFFFNGATEKLHTIMKRKLQSDDDHFAFFGLLPELRAHILSFLPLEDLKIIRTTCKLLQILIDEKVNSLFF